jgi:hypothetical protein
MKLMLAEERRIAADPGRRTSARTLRKLAAGHLLFELPDANLAVRTGEWDRFQIRNLGLAMQKRMAREFGGDAQKMRAHSVDFVARALGLRMRDWSEGDRLKLENFSLLLAMMPIESWSSADKQAAARIIRAKGSADEALYLKLMQKHSRFRAAMIRLGS